MPSSKKRKKANVPVAIRIPYSASSTDVSAQVLQLKDKKPDVVIFISYTADSILYMKTMKNLDYMPPMVIGDDTGFSDPSFVPAVADVAQGVMNRSAWDVGKPGSTTYKINEMYKAKTGRDLDDTSARNMQSFFALADAINRAGSTDPAKIREALTKTDLKPEQLMMGYHGVKFDETGQNILAATYLIQLHGKSYELVWPENAAIRQAAMADGGLERNQPMLLLQVIVGGLLLGAIYALFSSGLTLIWGMMNFINFAHGEFVMLGMYVALLVVVWLGGGPAAFGFAAAFALFVLGVVVYFSLIRHVMRGPMLAQILSTFGLALLLRYTAFWIFSANFVSLPQTSLSGTINIGGILMPVAQLVAGVIAIAADHRRCTCCSRAPRSAVSCSRSPKTATPRC